MAAIYHRGLKRCYINEKDDLLLTKKMKPLSLEYHCQVYLKLYPRTCKCILDVIVKSTNDIIDDKDLILLGKSRIGKIIKPGRIFNNIKKNESFYF